MPPTLSCMNWIFLSCTISRSASIATRTVRDEVGVAADRRGEVRVAVGREAEVTERLGGIARLLHRAEEDGVHEPLLGPTLHLLEHRLERGGRRPSLRELQPET